VIVAVSFLSLMVTNRTSDSCTRHPMMARHVAQNSAYHGAFAAAFSKGRSCGCASEGQNSAENQCFHDAPPYQNSLNASDGGTFRPSQLHQDEATYSVAGIKDQGPYS
jgi:hypothetical protein